MNSMEIMEFLGAKAGIGVPKSRAGLARACGGATSVEMAIVLPAFLLLLFGVVETGRIFWTQSTLQYAVEAAARCSAVNTAQCGTTSSIQSYAVSQSVGITVSSSNFRVTEPSCGHQVSISYSFNLIVTELYPGTITLNAQSCHP